MHICFNMQVLKYGGDLAVSAMTILFSMFQFINLPLTGVVQGSQPIVSFNYGAGDYGRVKKTLRYAIIACTAFSLCGTTLMLLFPALFIRLFNSDLALVSLGARMLRVYIFGCFFIGANSLYQQTYTSMGGGKDVLLLRLFQKGDSSDPAFVYSAFCPSLGSHGSGAGRTSVGSYDHILQ